MNRVEQTEKGKIYFEEFRPFDENMRDHYTLEIYATNSDDDKDWKLIDSLVRFDSIAELKKYCKNRITGLEKEYSWIRINAKRYDISICEYFRNRTNEYKKTGQVQFEL